MLLLSLTIWCCTESGGCGAAAVALAGAGRVGLSVISALPADGAFPLYVRALARVCMRACVHMCARSYVRALVRASGLCGCAGRTEGGLYGLSTRMRECARTCVRVCVIVSFSVHVCALARVSERVHTLKMAHTKQL